MLMLYLAFGVVGLVPAVEGARILGVFSLAAKSHYQFINPLMATLARAGHEVVVYTRFLHPNPPGNYTQVWLGEIPHLDDGLIKPLMMETIGLPHWASFDPLYSMGITFTEQLLHEEGKIQELLRSSESFDVVISEVFVLQEFALLLGQLFKAPVISVLSCPAHKSVHRAMGNSLSLSYIPDTGLAYYSKMSFSERLLNTVFSLRFLWFVYDYEYLPNIEMSLRKLFPDMPPLRQLVDSVSLLFLNEHQYAGYSQPWPPNIVPVAGIHIADPNPLPKDLKQFMDGAQDGVVLFSLGTYVPDDNRPDQYFTMFSNVFGKLKQRVLWKTVRNDLQNIPDNVKLVDWLPQQDVLAHPRCVLFLTHGGLLSQHETVHYGVPVIVIPHAFDQHRNARFYEEKGVGIRLELNTLSESGVLAAILEVLYNPKYKANIKNLSEIFRDRAMPPNQSVVFWTEYVLRHGGDHLRPASSQLYWYQLALLDVLAVMLLAVLSILTAGYYLLRVATRVFKKSIRTNEKID